MHLPYSINLAGLGDFEKALDAANDFLVHSGSQCFESKSR